MEEESVVPLAPSLSIMENIYSKVTIIAVVKYSCIKYKYKTHYTNTKVYFSKVYFLLKGDVQPSDP